MKKVLTALLIVAVLYAGIPYANAEEVAQDLDPMVSPDAVATVTGDNSLKAEAASKVTSGASSSDAVKAETTADKKSEEKKKQKTGKKKAGKAQEAKKKQKSDKKTTEKKKHSPSKSAKHKSAEKKTLPVKDSASQKVQ